MSISCIGQFNLQYFVVFYKIISFLYTVKSECTKQLIEAVKKVSKNKNIFYSLSKLVNSFFVQ